MHINRTMRSTAFAALLLLTPLAWSQATKPAAEHNFSRWEKEIAAYEKADRDTPPAKRGVVFTGASSIRKWKSLPTDFPGVNVINRGFGGSQTADATHFADRIVLPYAPCMVLIRAGGNDIHAGKTADQVFDDFKAFVDKIHSALPKTDVVYISQTAAPARWSERDEVQKLNALVEQCAENTPGVKYVETWDIVMRPDGTAREDLFLPDKLHFNAEGYRLMADRVRPILPKQP